MLTALVTVAVLTAEPTHELTLSPTVEWSAKFAHHEGTQLRYTFDLAHGVGAFAAWREHWFAGTTAFSDELVQNVREESQLESTVLLRRALVAGLSSEPLRGETSDGHSFSVRMSVGAGVARTEFELALFQQPPMFADAGIRPTGFGAVEFQYRITDHVSLSAAVDEFLFSAHLNELEGCNASDLDTTLPDFGPDHRPPLSEGCRLGAFAPGTIPLAHSVVASASSAIREVRTASVGVSVSF